MKYIMFEVKVGNLTQKVPIIFPNNLVHADVAKRMKHCLIRDHNMDGVEVVAAGDAHVEARCSGRSETLKLESQLEDSFTINFIDYGGAFNEDP